MNKGKLTTILLYLRNAHAYVEAALPHGQINQDGDTQARLERSSPTHTGGTHLHRRFTRRANTSANGELTPQPNTAGSCASQRGLSAARAAVGLPHRPALRSLPSSWGRRCPAINLIPTKFGHALPFLGVCSYFVPMPDETDARYLRLFDLKPYEHIIVRCQCGRIVQYMPGVLQRRHRLPSDKSPNIICELSSLAANLV